MQDLKTLSDSCRKALLSQMKSRIISKKYLGEGLKHNRYLWVRSNERKMIAFRVNNVSSTHVHQSFRLRATPVASRLEPVDLTALRYADSSSASLQVVDLPIDCSRIAPGYTEDAFQVQPRIESKKRKRKSKNDDEGQQQEGYGDEDEQESIE